MLRARSIAHLFVLLIAGCGEHHTIGDAAAAAPDAAIETDAGPRVCDLVAGPIELVPAADNPPGCVGAMTCDVWFGHGQHLSCPADGWTMPAFAGCDIWDCLCEDYPPSGFVADFSTGEVLDTRAPGRTCRYTLR